MIITMMLGCLVTDSYWDRDNDGVEFYMDCDDDLAGDFDCDGVPTQEDCDDSDASMPNNDADCDGVLTDMDCDDANPQKGASDSTITCQGTETLSILASSINFVLVPQGQFWMGSPTEEVGRKDDETQHRVSLTQSFFLLDSEMTQEAYEGILGANPSLSVGTSLPVENLTWHEAAFFANALTAWYNEQNGTNYVSCYTCTQEEDTECESSQDPYTCDGFRLPTEAEWEYAARAQSQRAFDTSDVGGDLLESENCDSLILSDGSDLSDFGWFCSEGEVYGSQPVARKTPNKWGLYDMHGNVWEWSHDAYETYGDGSSVNPVGEGLLWNVRGGSWSSTPEKLRAANRLSYDPTTKRKHIGFRLARSIIP